MTRAASAGLPVTSLAFIAGALLLLTSFSGLAKPAIEGVVKPLDAKTTTVSLDRTGVVWRRDVQADSESAFFLLHFTDILLSGASDFTVRIRDRANQLIVEVPGSAFAKMRQYRTPYLPGTYALIEIDNRRAVPRSQVAFKLAEIGVESRGAKILSIQDPLNPKDRPIARYAANSELTRAARAVAKLRYEKNKVLFSCTGFLVSQNLLLTNQHCFDSADICASAVAVFGYEEDADRNLRQGEEFRCQEIKDSDAGLDFTLLKLAGAPGARWGTLTWELGAPKKGVPLYIVQHPGGQPKRVTLDGCAVKTASAVGELAGKATDLGHTCDTENGSSGSPVLNLSHHVIALHHLGFSLNDARWLKENRAVKAAVIHSRILPFIN